MNKIAVVWGKGDIFGRFLSQNSRNIIIRVMVGYSGAYHQGCFGIDQVTYFRNIVLSL